ncbi:MAG: hypothetical protein BWY76_00305 [bacterium ADurb.Bin429]|nr:MAG: hypothetical protein BWY76_00305 [bacterium ADurb.Bin429]
MAHVRQHEQKRKTRLHGHAVVQVRPCTPAELESSGAGWDDDALRTRIQQSLTAIEQHGTIVMKVVEKKPSA